MTWIHREAIGGGRRLGIAGPSRSGKTYSSLRVAAGMASVLKGPVFLIDTDNEFSLDYADDFKFHIVDFQPPFTSERYQEAVEFCVKEGASIIIIDQMTSEHTGEGGMLERQEKLADELASRWKTSREKTTWAAWAQAKTPHGKLVSYVTRVKQPMIFNFRAKDKLKLQKKADGKQEPIHIGYTPICAEQFDYEMTAMVILPPNSDGKPDKALSEIRKPLRPIMRLDDQLDESLGVRLANWASGAKEPAAREAGPPQSDQAKSQHAPDPAAAELISSEQLAVLETRLAENDIPSAKMRKAAGVESLDQILNANFDRACKWIDAQIKAKSG